MSKTLFIMFYFPPFERVGGRRWAKHIKYLQRQNMDFVVLAGDYTGYSPWINDIETYKNKIERIPVTVYYPYYKQKLPNGIFDKIRWKWSYYSTKRAEENYPGNFWDDSRGYEDMFLKKARDIIKREGISHVCMSVGPFSYSGVLPKLKKEFKHLKISLDCRDYWNDGLDAISENKKEYELTKQQEVLNAVDLVLAPNSEMCRYFEQQFKKSTYLLPHCIDEEFQNISTEVNNNYKKDISFLYGGSLYNGMEKYILQLVELLKEIENSGMKACLKIRTMQPGYAAQLKKNGINVEVKPLLPVNEFIHLALGVDILLLFRPDWSPNGFSSKFYEAIALRKPIVYFGPNGEVDQFIKSKKLGFSMNEHTVKEMAKRIIDNKTSGSIPDRTFPLSEHTFEFQTKKLVDLWNTYYNFEN